MSQAPDTQHVKTLIHFSPLNVTPPSIFPIQINGLNIHQVSEVKSLGVILDSMLFFVLQIQSGTGYPSLFFHYTISFSATSFLGPHQLLLRLL